MNLLILSRLTYRFHKRFWCIVKILLINRIYMWTKKLIFLPSDAGGFGSRSLMSALIKAVREGFLT